MFLKSKRDGKIKGRTVAGGNKQRDYISKEDGISPTVTMESVILSCIIDADVYHRCRGTQGRRRSGYPKRVCSDTRGELKRYGFHQDLRNTGGHSGGDSPRSLQVLCITGQEGKQPVSGAMPERTVRDNGYKPDVLPEVHEEFKGH
jgi:hypothetical protein